MWECCLCRGGSGHDTISHKCGTAHTEREAFGHSRQKKRLRRSDCSGDGRCICRNGEKRARRKEARIPAPASVGGTDIVTEERVPAVGAVARAAVGTATNHAGGDPFSKMGDDDSGPANVAASFVHGENLVSPFVRVKGTARALHKSGALRTARKPPGADRQKEIPVGSWRSNPPRTEPGGGVWLGPGSSGPQAESGAAAEAFWRRTASNSVLSLEELGSPREGGTACARSGGVKAAAAAIDKE